MAPPRSFTFFLAPLWICSTISTFVILSRMMQSNSPSLSDGAVRQQQEGSGALDYLMGSGVPPLTRRKEEESGGWQHGQRRRGGARVRTKGQQQLFDEEEGRQGRRGRGGRNRRGKDPIEEELEQGEPADLWDMENSDEMDDDDDTYNIDAPHYNGGENEAQEEEEEELEFPETDDDDDPRPRKRPKGERWRGWNVNHENVNDDGDRVTDSSGTQQALPRNVGDYQWWRKSPLCFEVDQICHEKENNKWFYYTHPSPNDEEELLFQPTMELKRAAAKYDGGKDLGERRVSIKVSASSTLQKDEVQFEESGQGFIKKREGSDEGKCEISSTSTHVVLQSLFNDMIGEFYARTLLRLYHFMTDDLDDEGTKNGDKKFPWEEDIQFYVHIPYGNKKMLDGHKLLLSGMLSDPNAPTAKSLVDLFVKDEDVNGGDSGNDCQCYEKMVFCGYDVYTHDANIRSKDIDPAGDDRFSKDDDDTEEAGNEDYAVSRTFNYDMKYTLWAAMKLDNSGELDKGSCGRSAGTRGVEYECQEWSGLKDFLSSNFLRHYPTLEKDIADHRRDQLLREGLIDKSYSGNTKEFTVIGLTQRTYRRAWIDLPEIIEKCNKSSFERVVCVEVNVENTSSPFEQLILHRSLDVMIGVHGAQLTQAILLEPHAHVLELLPWITDYIRGNWVQTKHGPTPLGVIFHNTNLQHVGYSLNRTSVPMCEGVNEEAEQICFMKQRKKFIWENRDFIVGAEPILKYIEDFVLFGREKKRTCDEMKYRLDDRFVMYNIWCTKPSYWYPAKVKGVNDCIYGTKYRFDHTIPTMEDFLFDSRDDCCAAFVNACQVDDRHVGQQLKNTTLSVWHNYHRLSSNQILEQLLPPPKKKRGKKGGRVDG